MEDLITSDWLIWAVNVLIAGGIGYWLGVRRDVARVRTQDIQSAKREAYRAYFERLIKRLSQNPGAQDSDTERRIRETEVMLFTASRKVVDRYLKEMQTYLRKAHPCGMASIDKSMPVRPGLMEGLELFREMRKDLGEPTRRIPTTTQILAVLEIRFGPQRDLPPETYPGRS